MVMGIQKAKCNARKYQQTFKERGADDENISCKDTSPQVTEPQMASIKIVQSSLWPLLGSALILG